MISIDGNCDLEVGELLGKAVLGRYGLDHVHHNATNHCTLTPSDKQSQHSSQQTVSEGHLQARH